MTPPEPSRRRLALLLLVLAALGAALYSPSLSNEFVNWDDGQYTVRNAELQQPLPEAVGSMFTTFVLGNYNPLQRLSYYVDWHLGGGHAWVFRVVNLLLHVLNAGLVFLLLRQWLRREAVAWVGAVLFLILPANVENVAWISERKTLLATAFGLGAMTLWLRENPRAALACFVGGLLAKTSIVVMPGVLLLLDLQQRRQLRWGWYAAFTVPALAMTIVQMTADSGQEAVPLHGGSLVMHVATFFSVLPSYVMSVLAPLGHLPKHLPDPVTSFGDVRLWLGIALWAAAGYGAVRSWRGERTFFAACGVALAALHLTLVVPIPILVADRYLYFALPLLLGVVASALLDLPVPAQKPARVCACAWAVALMVGTISYAAVWRDSASLWTYAIERQPEDRESWMSLAGAYRERVGQKRHGTIIVGA